MKRKLDENDAPTIEVSREPEADQHVPSTTFDNLNLDARLLQSLTNQKYAKPTPVQAKVIPLALAGRNILAKSGTGTGKTAAYALPCIQAILETKSHGSNVQSTSVLVLVPTRDLSGQVSRVFATLSSHCGKDVRVLDLSQKASESVLATKLQENPDVIVSTPGKVAQLLKNSTLSLNTVSKLVIDEADIVLLHGYEDDINQIAAVLPAGLQVFLISATPEVDQLRETFAKDYSVVEIEDQEEKDQEVVQYVVKCGEEDKFLLIYVMFKLKLVKGKCIIFVHDLDRSYRLKLYLEQFGIRSCILNSELPVNSRLHAVEEFNRGLYDILIAADDQEVIGGVKRKAKSTKDNNENKISASEGEEEVLQSAKPTKTRKKDFGVSRGIDFQNVACVLNFDLPTSSKAYTHRIGRTARAGKSGMAFSFVVPRDEFAKHKYTSVPSSRHDEQVLEKIKARQAKRGKEIKDHTFNMAQIEGFRYRAQDALKAVTANKIREARTREIKQELLKSEKLAKHFEENPEDLKALRHDTSSSAGVIRLHSHLKHVPEYLLPGGKRQKTSADGLVSFNKDEKNSAHKVSKSLKGRGKPSGRRLDPLKSFKTKRKRV